MKKSGSNGLEKLKAIPKLLQGDCQVWVWGEWQGSKEAAEMKGKSYGPHLPWLDLGSEKARSGRWLSEHRRQERSFTHRVQQLSTRRRLCQSTLSPKWRKIQQ